MSDGLLIVRCDCVFGVGVLLFYRESLYIVRGEGVWFYGVDGRCYVDMYNNVFCVGHVNLDVVVVMVCQ